MFIITYIIIIIIIIAVIMKLPVKYNERMFCNKHTYS
jgi:hypothetical protein